MLFAIQNSTFSLESGRHTHENIIYTQTEMRMGGGFLPSPLSDLGLKTGNTVTSDAESPCQPTEFTVGRLEEEAMDPGTYM